MSSTVMNNLVREFGASIGIPDLQIDEEYRCNMMFDEVPVSFELGDGDESMYIYSLLGHVPDDGLEQLYAELLHANYVFADNGGSTLSVDSQSGNVVLLREERLELLRLSRLESVVEQFVNVAEGWMSRLRGGGTNEADAPPSGGAVSERRPPGGVMRV